jgi:hypothetical protein
MVMKDKTIWILIGAIVLIFVANHWLYKSEVACEESGGVYVRAVWGYKCVELK